MDNVWQGGPAAELLGSMIERQAAEFGDKVCMYFDDVPVTYAEMHARSNSVANWLHDIGIGIGDRVVLQMQNCPEFMYLWFGAAKVGALTVPINTAYRGDFLSHQVRGCRARVAVVSDDLAGGMLQIAAECPELARVMIRPGDHGSAADFAALPGVSVHDAGEMLAPPSDGLEFSVELSPELPVAIYYTSGTTGLSKGAVITHRYVDTVAEIIAASRNTTADEIAYGPVPLFHFSGMLGLSLAVLRRGGTVVIDRWFSVSHTWERIHKYRATMAILVGPMLTLIWGLAPEPTDADGPLKVLGSAPIPPSSTTRSRSGTGSSSSRCTA